MKKVLYGFVMFASFLFLQNAFAAKTAPELQLRADKTAEDQKFYQTINPLIDQLVMAIKKENGNVWSPLCDPKEGIIFRYLGHYTTKLNCKEWCGLFQETKSRWWGRHDGSGQPITGTFKKIWQDRFDDIAKNYQTVGVNRWIKIGNVPNQGMDKLPFVDLTWSGPKGEEMGWQSLHLFFIFKNGQWWLKGLDLYHWTI